MSLSSPGSGKRTASTTLSHSSFLDGCALMASKPAAVMRMSSNVLAFSLRYLAAAAWYGSAGRPSSTTAIRPTAVANTSGVPPGMSAKPPLCLSKQLATNFLHLSALGNSPPRYLRARMALEVARRLALGMRLLLGSGASLTKPPSGVCKRLTYRAAFTLACTSGVWARAGARQTRQASEAR